jgi:hypothetical protein
MYDTGGSYSVCQLAAPDDGVARRLSWLKFELSPDTERRRLAFEREQRRTLSMLRPRTTEEAYRRFGMFLGLLPPLALFGRFLLGLSGDDEMRWVAAGVCVLMNLICCLVGRKFGGFLGRRWRDPRAHALPALLVAPFLMALLWGAVTGAAGGAVVVVFGAIFGVLIAVPVALAAFPVFAFLHRLLSHGGMIEERQLRPLAFCVPLTAAALILSPWLK